VRPRRQVHPFLLKLLAPFFRFSYGRSAWVLRIGDGTWGPVLVPKSDRQPVQSSGSKDLDLL
jgi:hypothetical protein